MHVYMLSSTLCDPMDSSPSGSSVMGFLRQEYWVAISSSRDLPDSGIELTSLVSPTLAGRFFTILSQLGNTLLSIENFVNYLS